MSGVDAEVALGLCVDADGRVLLLLRPKDPYGGLWSLPGGKREPGEGLAATCRRELREELGREVELTGLRLLVDETLLDSEGAPVGRWILGIFLCRLAAGDPLPDNVAWFALDELDRLDMIPTDRRFIVDALATLRYGVFRQAVARLCDRMPQLVSYV